MIEVGKVVEIKGDTVKVELESKERCSGCSMVNFCHLTGEGNRYIEAEKIPDTKLGDKVKVEIRAARLLTGTTLLFLIPAAAFIVGAAVGQILMEGIVFSLILGFLFLALVFFILHLLDKKLAGGKNKTRVIAIL